jgi:hypothetical protein
MTIASVLHRMGPFAGSGGGLGGRLTKEGSRSMAGQYPAGKARLIASTKLPTRSHRSAPYGPPSTPRRRPLSDIP